MTFGTASKCLVVLLVASFSNCKKIESHARQRAPTSQEAEKIPGYDAFEVVIKEKIDPNSTLDVEKGAYHIKMGKGILASEGVIELGQDTTDSRKVKVRTVVTGGTLNDSYVLIVDVANLGLEIQGGIYVVFTDGNRKSVQTLFQIVNGNTSIEFKINSEVAEFIFSLDKIDGVSMILQAEFESRAKTLPILAYGTAARQCVIKVDSVAKCWGDGKKGQLGQLTGEAEHPLVDEIVPVEIENLTYEQITGIALGESFTCLTLDNQGYCFGDNVHGELGNGTIAGTPLDPNSYSRNTTPVQLLEDAIIKIVAGENAACALTGEGIVKCWGYFHFEQLQSFKTIDLGTGRTAVDLAMSAQNLCVILDNGWLKCSGANSLGELGQGSAIGCYDDSCLGDGVNPIDLGTRLNAAGARVENKAIGVSIGFGTACAVLDSFAVKCWGNGADGQLGLGSIGYPPHRGDVPGQMGDALPEVAIGKVVQVTVGEYFVCALMQDGGLKCWGNNSLGQLGIAPGGTVGLNDGDVEALHPIAGVDGQPLKAVQLGGGAHATCAVLEDGFVVCWGSNGSGQLGVGDTTDSYVPVQVAL